ncbi:MGDG synthase family glycosyltransferase [Alicyclobacillus acidoterrestris]|uniref:Galactosyldiacylglycerol synthase n=1 Tax=Alicyclobacillus acidoterrestris (strain ATCC 49025 / DSM 3922 / CIP 106132 / NCIMB 13137 / GD3B) TaxID=1356854 RepID=A0A9E7CQE1_ALIAG|nr:glycosyltransferase [Alicyclobacillus acidoterrestris]UNO47634.1 galactosyldiacylglycerol synthase [Alicyclobacillus acidoterrestris]
MRVLLLYGSFGDGHRQVARAIEDVLVEVYGAHVSVVDPFRQTNRLVAAFNEWLYETLTAHAPFVYGWSYNWTRTLSPKHVLWKLLALFSRRATWAELRAHQPDVVVQLFPDHALVKYPRDLSKSPLLVTVLTDYALHSRWFHANVDLYLLPVDQMVAKAAPFLSGRDQIFVTGIPIRAPFSACRVDSAVPHGMIVISAGGRGVFPDLWFVVRSLLEAFPDSQVAVLCGRNEAMRKRIEAWSQRLSETRLIAIPFTDDVASYVQRAAFVVAKAGGISISECLASGKPMLFFKPQPGQEQHNAHVVTELGAGRVAYTRQEFQTILAQYRGASLAEMARAAIANAHPDAAIRAASAIVQMWQAKR